MVSGKAFRMGLRKPIPRLLNGQRKIPPEQQKIPLRIVPAFTIQSLQKNTIVEPPPRLNNMDERPVKPSLFRKHYLRGDFPINLEFDTFGNKIGWRVEIDKLDFHYYLPMFFDGLVETEVPYNFFAHQGIRDMLANGAHKVFPVLPQLIIPIKRALNTRNIEVICKTLRVLQELVKCDEMIGEALVPYYRQILPVFNLFKEKNINCGDKIDYTQRRKQNVGDLINETLELLERTGGEDAFINIKYMIPTYESCILN